MAGRATITNTFIVNTLEDGKDVQLILSPDTMQYDADSNGAATSAQTFTVNVSMIVEGMAVTGFTMSYGTLPSGITVISGSATSYVFRIASGMTAKGSFDITASVVISGKTYTSKASLKYLPSRQGAQGNPGSNGAPGHVGRWFYYAGEFNGIPSSYVMEATQSPFVKSGNDFYMLDFNGYPSYQNDGNDHSASTMPGNSQQYPDWNKEWSVMAATFKYYIAEAMFAKYANFGSFIINGDWLISTNGNLNGSGSTSPASYFDPMFVEGGVRVISARRNIISTVDVPIAGGIRVKAGQSYTLSLTGRTLGSSTTLTVSMNGGGGTRTLTITGTATQTQTVTFTPSINGTCTVKAKASTLTQCIINTLELRANFTTFTPTFAVDGLTGEAYMNNAHVRGEITAQSIVADDGNFVTEISPGVTTWRSVKYPLAAISIGVDNDGMFFKMTDVNGNLRWDISQNGNGKITGDTTFGTIYLKSVSSAAPDLSEFSLVTRADCTQYYTNDGKTYTSPSTTASKIPAGYYVGPNNGSFRQNVDTLMYVVLIYEYGSGGVLIGTIEYEFNM